MKIVSKLGTAASTNAQNHDRFFNKQNQQISNKSKG
jgi:hypothetical protein